MIQYSPNSVIETKSSNIGSKLHMCCVACLIKIELYINLIEFSFKLNNDFNCLQSKRRNVKISQYFKIFVLYVRMTFFT